jgi:hypothetical protein
LIKLSPIFRYRRNKLILGEIASVYEENTKDFIEVLKDLKTYGIKYFSDLFRGIHKEEEDLI